MPIKSKLPTYRVDICFGLAPGYDLSSAETIRHQREAAGSVCYRYCEQERIGLTITETAFVYPGGQEPGLVVSLINYPRFPRQNVEVLQIALKVADELLFVLDQERMTVVEIPGETFLVERDAT